MNDTNATTIIPDGFVPVQVLLDPDGYLMVPTRVTTVDAAAVLREFLDALDPGAIADAAIREEPDLDPVAGALAVIRRMVPDGD